MSNSLIYRLLAQINDPEPILGQELILILAPLILSKELYELFIYTSINLIKNKVYVSVQISTLQVKLKDQSLKTYFSNLYYAKSDLNYYRFCKQCRDYFNMTNDNKNNCIPFVASFFHNKISICRK